MSEEAKKSKRIPRRRKTALTVRQKAEKLESKTAKSNKPSKLSKLKIPFVLIIKFLKHEIYFHPQSNRKFYSFLTKKRKFFPRYFYYSWKELRQVSWPSFSQAIKLSFAVFIFVVVFATFITLIDYGFNQAVQSII